VSDVIAMLLGVAAGVVAGLLGVGGGILFVPALVVVLGLSQVRAEATSLLAVIPVSLVGSWRQHRYDNVRLRDGLVVGALSAGGVLAGVLVANAVPERALEVAFALLLLVIAFQLLRRGLDQRRERLAGEEE
jgi:uncharacterized protein